MHGVRAVLDHRVVQSPMRPPPGWCCGRRRHTAVAFRVRGSALPAAPFPIPSCWWPWPPGCSRVVRSFPPFRSFYETPPFKVQICTRVRGVVTFDIL